MTTVDEKKEKPADAKEKDDKKKPTADEARLASMYFRIVVAD
jgi:hypothetical protein